MLGDSDFPLSWIIYILFPIVLHSQITENPLKTVQYAKLSKIQVKAFLELKDKIETKMNAKFISKGLKVKQIDYLSFLHKIV
jgi:hypothetical protein